MYVTWFDTEEWKNGSYIKGGKYYVIRKRIYRKTENEV